MPRRWRKLIILRGLPGSGKTEKARALITYYGRGEIVSAFDYFRTGPNGEIVFRRRDLWKAHREARRKALQAMREGKHPVIICNINVECWMMYPFVSMGYDLGYYIEFLDMPLLPIEELYWNCEGRVPWWLLRKWERNYDEVDQGLSGVLQVLNDEKADDWWSERRDW